MLHPDVLGEMLDDEIAAAQGLLRCRVDRIERDGVGVAIDLADDLVLHLDGSHYDAEPFRVAVTNAEGELMPHERWPPGMSLGIHPVLDRPFACVQGTYEYHAHPSHLTDHWSTYRNELRLTDLLDHLLRKASR